MTKETEFSVGGVILRVPVRSRETDYGELFPGNFGEVVAGRIYRGARPEGQGWRTLMSVGVKSLVSLFSARNDQERAGVEKLSMQPEMAKINHITVDTDNADAYFNAARQAVSLPELVYIHCSRGANRTGVVALLVKAFEDYGLYGPVTETKLKDLLTEATQFGFDYDRSTHRENMERILNQIYQRGIIRL